MTTYQKGHEPAGAPVTWEYHAEFSSVYIVTLGHDASDHPATVNVYEENYADAICAAFHAAAEWRKLAEEAASDTCPMQVNAEWMSRFDAMKEAFGE